MDDDVSGLVLGMCMLHGGATGLLFFFFLQPVELAFMSRAQGDANLI